MKKKNATPQLLVVIALLITSGACGRKQNKAQESGTQYYKLSGTVQSVDPKDHAMVLQHCDIPGFMADVTMRYSVRKEEDLQKVGSGNQIEADLVVSGNVAYLENVRITARVKGNDKELSDK
jgi:Cu/Ag efflux protein CusF